METAECSRGSTKRAFRARRPPIFTVGNMRKGQVLPLPP